MRTSPPNGAIQANIDPAIGPSIAELSRRRSAGTCALRIALRTLRAGVLVNPSELRGRAAPE